MISSLSRLTMTAKKSYTRWTEGGIVLRNISGLAIGLILCVVIGINMALAFISVISIGTVEHEPIDPTEMTIERNSINDDEDEVVDDSPETVDASPESEAAEVEVESVKPEVKESEAPVSASKYSGSYFKRMGEIHENGWRYTWYSSRVLRHYRTAEWVADSEGIYRDSDGFVVVACQSVAHGGTVPTPFGIGKVYDDGCDYGTIDVYVNF